MRSDSLTARKEPTASEVTVGASGVVDAAVILDFSKLIFTELGEYELPDFWFRVRSKRRLKASDVFILCGEAADVLTIRHAKIAKYTTGFTLRSTKVAGNSSRCAEELRSFDAV